MSEINLQQPQLVEARVKFEVHHDKGLIIIDRSAFPQSRYPELTNGQILRALAEEVDRQEGIISH